MDVYTLGRPAAAGGAEHATLDGDIGGQDFCGNCTHGSTDT